MSDLVFVDPKYLDYLQSEADLTHVEMVNDYELGGPEWEVVGRAGLSPRQLECFRLYYWQGFSERGVAGVLGLKRATVRNHLDRARAKLKKHLENMQK